MEEDSTLDSDANDTYITPSELRKESGISAFLTLPVSLQKKKEVRERNFIRDARVLTSEESLKMLEEQEEKKDKSGKREG